MYYNDRKRRPGWSSEFQLNFLQLQSAEDDGGVDRIGVIAVIVIHVLIELSELAMATENLLFLRR